MRYLYRSYSENKQCVLYRSYYQNKQCVICTEVTKKINFKIRNRIDLKAEIQNKPKQERTVNIKKENILFSCLFIIENVCL